MRLFLLLASSVSLLALAACEGQSDPKNVNVTGNGMVDCQANPDDCVKPDRGDNL